MPYISTHKIILYEIFSHQRVFSLIYLVFNSNLVLIKKIFWNWISKYLLSEESVLTQITSSRQLIFFSLYVWHFEEIFHERLVGELIYREKIWEGASHIFWIWFGMKSWVGATTHQESMISRTLHPTSLHAYKRGFCDFFICVKY